MDAIDANIITLLQTDGRCPNTTIARRLGVAEATVRKRIARLLRERVIKIGAWADPLKVGYQHHAIIEIQVHLPDIERAAKKLATLPEIFFLGICTGSFDIFAAAVFRSHDHMHEFITKRLVGVPGIQRTSTSSITRMVKREYAVPVVNAGRGPRPALDSHGARPRVGGQRPRRVAWRAPGGRRGKAGAGLV